MAVNNVGRSGLEKLGCFIAENSSGRSSSIKHPGASLNVCEFVLSYLIKKKPYILEKDQLWKLPDAHIRIVGVGRHLTHFKHCKTLDEKRVTTQIQSIVDLQKYLADHKAKLVQETALKAAA